MTTAASGHTTGTSRTADIDHTPRLRTRRGEETKPSFKTTELIVYVLAVIGVLIASAVTGDAGTDNGGDVFAADKAWWFITLLTIGYMVSRGLAKAGSPTHDRDPRTD
jgi:hypothetical protein